MTFITSYFSMVAVTGTSSIDCNFIHKDSRPTKVYVFGKSSSRSLQKYVVLLSNNRSVRSCSVKRKGRIKVTCGSVIKKNCYITVSNNDRPVSGFRCHSIFLSRCTSDIDNFVHRCRSTLKVYIFEKHSSRAFQKYIVL